MPVISLRQFGDIGKAVGDAGKGIGDVAGKVTGGAADAVEQTKQVTDQVGEVGDMVGQVKDIAEATKEAMEIIGTVYDFILRYMWAFQLLFIIVVLIIIMEQLCCIRLWLQCFANSCCWPITFGMWLHRKGCCTGMANCCLACKHFIPDIEEKEKRAALLNRRYNGCDSTYLPTMCGTIKLPEGDAKAAAEWRLSTMVSKWLPCVPESWRDVTKSNHWIKEGKRKVKGAAKRAKTYGNAATTAARHRVKSRMPSRRRSQGSFTNRASADPDAEKGNGGYDSQESGVSSGRREEKR